jgi:hypothetical protein
MILVSAPALAHDPSRYPGNPPDIENMSRFIEDLRKFAEDSRIQGRWDAYLKQQTLFTNQEHRLVILKLGEEFSQAIGKLEKCTVEIKKEYNSGWLDDFLKEFDQEYISRNLNTIKFVLMCVSAKAETASICEPFVKDVIYREAFYFQELREYAGHLIKFSQTLDNDTQGKIKSLVEYAKSIKEIPDNIFGYMYAWPGVRNQLRMAALQDRKEIDPRLVEFFSKYPLFSKSFDLMRVVRDLKRFEKRNDPDLD